MENCSNCTTPQPDTFKTTGFLVFSTVMLITAVAAIFFNILTAVVLSTRKEVLLPIRILLVNLLAGTMFTAVAVVMQNTDSTILAANSNVPPAEAACRVYVWFFRSSAVVRLSNLAAYSIAVMTVVKRGRKHLKPVHTLPTIAITWLYALLVSIHWVIPSVSWYTYISDVRCASQSNASTVGLEISLLTLWIIVGGIIPTITCIAVIIAAFCYIRKLQVSEVTLFKKGLVRLALFLFLANVSNLINMIVPPILLHLDRNLSVTFYLITSVNTIMLWSTALVLVIFIQPVKAKVVAILCCSWCKKRRSSRLDAQIPAPVPYKEVTLLDKSNKFSD